MNAHANDLHQTDKPLWFLNTLTYIRAGAHNTAGTMSMVDQLIPAGFESPWHLHRDEDESFFVIEGEVSVFVDGKTVRLGPGGFAFGPRGIPHGFRIEGDKPARLVLITSGAGFAAFVADVSAAADTATLPQPQEPDVPALIAAAGRQNIDILGPLQAKDS
jgi:quercetin dioxygenase-like cupin family protein